MHRYRSNNSPRWLLILAGILLFSAAYYILRGFSNFLETGGTGVSATALDAPTVPPPASDGSILSTLDFFSGTPLAVNGPRVCQDFKVKVSQARIRECPNETCKTMDFSPQGTIICVYGVVPDATSWYEINVDPKDPVIQLGYMNKSVLAAVNPTSTPKPTLNLPTVTPIPTNTARPTSKPVELGPMQSTLTSAP